MALQKYKEIQFQSTHPRRVWHGFVRSKKYQSYVSIHTPTKGVTQMPLTLNLLNISFNPHTHEGCDKE